MHVDGAVPIKLMVHVPRCYLFTTWFFSVSKSTIDFQVCVCLSEWNRQMDDVWGQAWFWPEITIGGEKDSKTGEAGLSTLTYVCMIADKCWYLCWAASRWTDWSDPRDLVMLYVSVLAEIQMLCAWPAETCTAHKFAVERLLWKEANEMLWHLCCYATERTGVTLGLKVLEKSWNDRFPPQNSWGLEVSADWDQFRLKMFSPLTSMMLLVNWTSSARLLVSSLWT